ncbi:hypothetical protein CDL15_Pgr010569 [Punica granatum]|uniref:Uncharacterized protein n=1 Tax=Punica granatum TaxID=22663 RepID=A0A218XHI3_PUNGR|nr:hypothetical protein CDL15_Pgr010569 [Punica granatum]
MLRKLAEPTWSCYLGPCRACSPARVYFHASQVRRDCRLVPLAALPGLFTCASLLSRFANTRSLLACASCNLAGSAHLCEFTFVLCKVTEPARSCFLRPGPICSPARVYFHATQVRRVSSLVLLSTLSGLLTRASLLSCFASMRSLLARASVNLAGFAHPCEFTFILPKFAETAGSFFLRPCRVSSPVRVYIYASHVRGACSLVLLTTLPGRLTCASLLSCFASSPSLLGRASCDLAQYAHPCEFTFMLRKFIGPAGSFFLRPCQVCSPVRIYIHASQVRRASRSCFLRPCWVCSPVRVHFEATLVRRACSLVLLATLPSLLTRASLPSCFASLPSLLGHATCKLAGSDHPREFTFMLRKFAKFVARASFDVAGSPHPCDFTFMLRKFVETAGSFFLRPCRVCSPVRVYYHASQIRGTCSLVLLATLPGLLTCASLLSCFARSPSLLGRASCDLARYAHPREFTFMLRKFANGVCSPVRVFFHASQVRRAYLVVLLGTLPGLLTRASLLSCFASLPSLSLVLLLTLLAPAALPGLLTRASLLSRFANTRNLLARASCNLAGSAHMCEFTFVLCKVAEPARSCFLRPGPICSPA